ATRPVARADGPPSGRPNGCRSSRKTSSKSPTIILQGDAFDTARRLSDGARTSGPTSAPWTSWSKKHHEHWFGISGVVEGTTKRLREPCSAPTAQRLRRTLWPNVGGFDRVGTMSHD